MALRAQLARRKEKHAGSGGLFSLLCWCGYLEIIPGWWKTWIAAATIDCYHISISFLKTKGESEVVEGEADGAPASLLTQYLPERF